MKRKTRWLLFAGLLAVALLCWVRFSGAAENGVPAAPPPGEGMHAEAGSTEEDLLQLVNGAHAIQREPAELVSAYPAVAVREVGIQLHPAALEALEAMFDAAKAEGVEGLFLSSGYRDYAEQKQIYAEAEDKALVQPAGHSEHQTGLAADILALGVAQEGMGGSRQGRWLAENAWRFGFLLRYPRDKQSVTGIAYEPWHFRYVGLEPAKYCYNHDLCLEEYLQK